MNSGKKSDNLSKVLFILEKDDNIDYSLSTHSDLENVSFFPDEKEVLFFPFSSFERKKLKLQSLIMKIYILLIYYI